MSLVTGKNVIIAEFNSVLNAYVVYGCAKSCSLNLGTEFIETTVKGTGRFKTFVPAGLSFTGTLEGLTSLGNTNLLSLADLRQRQIAGTALQIRIARTSESGSIYNDEGTFFIESTEDSSSFDSVSSFTVSIKGTGILTQNYTPTEILANVRRFEYTGINGETNIVNVIDKATGGTITLAGKTLLGFYVDGIGYSKMVGASPVNKEFAFNSLNGQIQIAIPIEPATEIFGYYR